MSDLAEDDWINAAEALQINESKAGVALWSQILERARDGIIQARAQHYIVTGGQRPGRISFDKPETGVRKFTCHVLESNFFWAGSGGALEANWVTGDFSTWIDQKWHCRAYGVQFRRSEIEAMVPAATKLSLNSEPQATLPTHTDAEMSEWIGQAPITSSNSVSLKSKSRKLSFRFPKDEPIYTGVIESLTFDTSLPVETTIRETAKNLQLWPSRAEEQDKLMDRLKRRVAKAKSAMTTLNSP